MGNDCTYYVVRVMECPTCHGAGEIMNGSWERYWGEHKAGDYANVDAWFAAEGYAYPPDEYEMCCECRGSGWVDGPVPIAEALRNLGVICENQTDGGGR